MFTEHSRHCWEGQSGGNEVIRVSLRHIENEKQGNKLSVSRNWYEMKEKKSVVTK